METLEEQLRETLKPLYKEMLEQIPPEAKNLSPFCVQWGKDFPTAPNTGILFIGKATNGWITKERNVDILFNGNDTERIFARPDQMKWVKDYEHKKVGYNTCKSAFWRTIKKISSSVYEPLNWNSRIAWSNLYKVAPFKQGNPTGKLRKLQLPYCRKILEAEIGLLQPRFIILFTSHWDKDFLYSLNQEHTKSLESAEHGIKIYQIDGRYFISAPHPQGKPEKEIAKTIISLIQKYDAL